MSLVSCNNKNVVNKCSPHSLKLSKMKTRLNAFEEIMRLNLISRIKFVFVYESTPSSKILEDRKSRNNRHKLIMDAKSPVKTINGNEKTTEFVVHCPTLDINWRIECKSQKSYSNIICSVYDELDYVKELKEDKLCLLLKDAYDHPYVRFKLERLILEKNILNKVWFGNEYEFDELLLTQIHSHN